VLIKHILHVNVSVKELIIHIQFMFKGIIKHIQHVNVKVIHIIFKISKFIRVIIHILFFK